MILFPILAMAAIHMVPEASDEHQPEVLVKVIFRGDR